MVAPEVWGLGVLGDLREVVARCNFQRGAARGVLRVYVFWFEC